MKRLLIAGLLCCSASAWAQGDPCPKPEYAFISTASKSELREEYCYLTRKARREERGHQLTQEMIAKKRDLHLDTVEDGKTSLDELKAANSCKVAAATLAEALLRRFKNKPPSCN
jgi:hypothetical protein